MKTLSDKIYLTEDRDGYYVDAVIMEDVKEFIKDLKERIIEHTDVPINNFFCCLIDKLAGNKLIWERNLINMRNKFFNNIILEMLSWTALLILTLTTIYYLIKFMLWFLIWLVWE